MTSITIQCSDNVTFVVEKEALKISNMIYSCIEDGDEDDEVLPLLTISSQEFTPILEYMNYYKDNKMAEIPKPNRKPLNEIVASWYIQYIEKHFDNWFNLFKAAHFLDIEPLLSLFAANYAPTLAKHAMEGGIDKVCDAEGSPFSDISKEQRKEMEGYLKVDI